MSDPKETKPTANEPKVSNIDVLVVGAGPTGLTMAADLLRRGIKVRLIDQGAGPSIHTKALGIQAGTLEALDSTLGREMTGKMLELGNPVVDATVHIDGSKSIPIDLSIIKSEYNYILILPQSATEKILSDEFTRLGGTIEWNTALVDLKEADDGAVGLTSKDEIISAKYLVGCDGAHSMVRKKLNLKFKGARYAGEFILGDAQINWVFPNGVLHVFISRNGVMPCFPLDKDGFYRLIPIPKKAASSIDANITMEEFRAVAEKISSVTLDISTATWITRFRVHHRMTNKFNTNRVYLAGDAAHIHSPAGGQGMNIGIQDALNLSHKLYLVIKRNQDAKLLRIYNRQRYPVALGTLWATHIVFSIAIASENLVTRFIRRWIMPRIIRNKKIQHRVIHAISEVKTARREIAWRKAMS